MRRHTEIQKQLLSITPPSFQKSINDLAVNSPDGRLVRPDTSHPYLVALDSATFHQRFGKPLFRKLTKQQSLQSINHLAIMFKDADILKAPDGVYTWLLYSSKGSFHLIFSMVKTLLEATNKHLNMNMLIGISRHMLPFEDPSTRLWFGGECLKRGHSYRFNFLSGSYMLEFNKKWIQKTGDPQIEKHVWFPILLEMMESFVAKQHVRVSQQQRQQQVRHQNRKITITYTTEELITPSFVPFVKSYYREIEPINNERYVFVRTQEDVRKLKKYKKNMSIEYPNKITMIKNMNQFFKKRGMPQQKLPDPPEFPADVSFLWLSEI